MNTNRPPWWQLGVITLLAVSAVVALTLSGRRGAAQPENRNASQPAESPPPNPQVGERLSRDNAVMLLIDHQAGLFSLVQDQSPAEFKNNVLALANTAKLYKLPTILTTSAEDGPNGVMIPELKEMFPDAPYIARPGQINAWDNEDFVNAVKKTGRRQLIMAGIVTDVCVAFPALSARKEGYQVFAVTDASGTFNTSVRDAALMRMTQAGVEPINWFAVACELQRDWRDDGQGLATLFSNHLPGYRNLITSHQTKLKRP